MNDGGPAFPTMDFYDEKPIGQTFGMSLRDYFAAHAPTEYASWYAPKMPPRPAVIYDHEHPNEHRCTREWDCVPVNVDELRAYDDERRLQLELQWPYAWADAMIAERKRQH